MMDPYVYVDTDILINKLNIRDGQELIDVEAQLFIANVLDMSTMINKINFETYESLASIHHHLFQDLYSWAGEFRIVNIFKEEQALSGLSITYSDKGEIRQDLQNVFSWSNKVEWNYDNPTLTEDFAIFMTRLWRIHPFREGNTRTVSVYMNSFAEKQRLNFNGEILSQNPGYLRKALVLSAVEEAPESKYLLIMIKDALGLMDATDTKRNEEKSNKYKVIQRYDVTSYKQKPFKTDKDTLENKD